MGRLGHIARWPALRWALCGWLAVSVLVGCDGTYVPPPAPPDPDPPPADPTEALLRSRAQGEAPYMIRQGASQHTTLEAGGRWTFVAVLEQGLCYKVLAQGESSVGELELRLYDDHGVLAQEDALTGSGAILGTVRPICPQEPTTYRVEARGAGPGVVFAQVYASP
jgi:hypothetical protein